jgi:hypothetical protein
MSGTKLRPSSGRETTFFCSTMKLAVLRAAQSSGAAAVTSIDRSVSPTARVRSRLMVSPTWGTMLSRRKVAKPARAAERP